jgi:hypothetical protein
MSLRIDDAEALRVTKIAKDELPSNYKIVLIIVPIGNGVTPQDMNVCTELSPLQLWSVLQGLAMGIKSTSCEELP